MDEEYQVFNAVEKFEIAGRGTVLTGPAPFSFRRDEHDPRFYEAVWRINHPDTIGRLYRIKGVESYATVTISRGTSIAILVEEIKDDSGE